MATKKVYDVTYHKKGETKKKHCRQVFSSITELKSYFKRNGLVVDSCKLNKSATTRYNQ